MTRSRRAGPALALLALLGACASPPPGRFDPATQARLRVYPSIPAQVIIHHGCGQRQTLRGVASDFSVRSFLTPDKTFSEYTLPAGKPATVRIDYWWPTPAALPDTPTRWNRCGPLQATFMPQAGQDYEARLHSPGWFSTPCQGLELRRLVPQGEGRLGTEDVPLMVFSERADCAEQAVR
ncbi:MAG: hypothetical protein ACK5YQ_12510 [Betaproteobacteria bacterium]|jgi:hypothetical protein